MKPLNYLPYLILAILLHSILFIFILHFNKISKPMGLKNKKLLQAYIYQPQKISVITKQQKGIEYRAKGKGKMQQSKNIIQSDKKNQLLHKINLSKGQHNKLLQLLHNAIAHTKQYPATAAILGQSGKVIIKFILSPNGKVSHLKVLKTSGYRLLDNAAIAAVKAINPFLKAKSYLNDQTNFTIAIVFN